jgi:hypothetical protein
MLKILQLLQSRRREIGESDSGRRFGWFMERDGECIGELEYKRWDENSQFWHEYVVCWRRPGGDPTRIEDWSESGIELRNRKFPEVVVRGFLSAPGSVEGVVAIRNASVPDRCFRR